MGRKKRITKKVLFEKTIQIMQPIMKLDDWKILVVFSHSSRMKNTAECEASPEYKIASIILNYGEMKDLTHNEIVSVAIHEMIHCVLWELGDWALSLSKRDPHKLEISRKYEESAVTAFEKILLPLVATQLNNKLKTEGYNVVDLTFTDLEIQHDR